MDVETEQTLRTFTGHTDMLDGCALSPDGRTILSASHDETLRLWMSKQSRRCAPLLAILALSELVHSVPMAVPFSPPQMTAACNCGHREWADAAHLYCNPYRFRTVHSVPMAASFSPTSDDETLRLWTSRVGRCCAPLLAILALWKTVHSVPMAVPFSPPLTIRHCGCGCRNRADAAHLQRPYWRGGRCAFSPDGHTALSASRDRTLRLWNVETGQMLRAFADHAGGVNAAPSVPMAHHSLRLLDKTLRLWMSRAGKR